MPLTEQQLSSDLTQAMRARDSLRVSVLRSVIAAAKNLKVEKRGAELTEGDLVQVVRRELKKREEALEFAGKGGRDDLVTQNRAEIEVLAPYAPTMLDTAALEAAIRAIRSGGGSSIGAIMAALKERHGGAYDGRQASEIAKRVLAEAAA